MTSPNDLSRHEADQLLSICGSYRGYPYWWGKKTMPKLQARGFVEPHPERKGAYVSTQAGVDFYEAHKEELRRLFT